VKPIPKLTRTDLARFWAKVHKGDECWEWTALADKNGYGKFWLQGYTYRANRISYAIANGDPGELHVCHTCDNPLCVNPAHLWLGTSGDNTRDKVAKNRQTKGESDGNSKLTTEMVGEILDSEETNLTLAARYGVSDGLISHIRRGSVWKHISRKQYVTGAQVNSKTGVKGVSPTKEGKYTAAFTQNGKRHYLGTFGTVEEATEVIQKERLL
jgi:hypothetical protein